MSLSVDYIYQWSLRLINKNQSGTLNSIKFASHWNDAQAAYQDDLLGRFQKNTNGKSGINTGLIENQTILTKLTPFTQNATLTITSGSASKPSKFVYELALRINGVDVYKIRHDQTGSVNKSVIDPPSAADDAYYAAEYGNTYSFLPTTVTSASLDYIVSPTDVFWNFTFDGNGRQVYSSSGSTQPVWLDNDCREITKRMLKSLGVTFKDGDFATFGQSIINSGS